MCHVTAQCNGVNEELEREKQKRLETDKKCRDAESSEATLRRTIADLETQILNLDSAKVTVNNIVSYHL